MTLPPGLAEDPSCGCGSVINPDPDIAGLGVLLAFLVSSVLALILSNTFLISRLAESANPIDLSVGMFFKRIWKWPFRRPWIFETMVISAARSYGDLQMVTTIGVIITAIIKLKTGITIYHIAIVTDFALIASSSQIMVLYAVAVKDDYKHAKMSSSFLGWIRAILLLSQVVILTVALVIRFDAFWSTRNYTCRASCTLRKRYENGGTPLAWFFVIWSLGGMTRSLGLTRFITEQLKKLGNLYLQNMGVESSVGRFKVHKEICRRVRDSWRDFLGQRFCHPTPWQYAKKTIRILCKTFAAVLFLLGWFSFILFNSNLISTIIAAFWYIVGIAILGVDWNWGAGYFREHQVEDTESSWGFGQILPLVILLIPNLALTATYADILEKVPHEEVPSSNPESKNEGVEHLPVLTPPQSA